MDVAVIKNKLRSKLFLSLKIGNENFLQILFLLFCYTKSICVESTICHSKPKKFKESLSFSCFIEKRSLFGSGTENHRVTTSSLFRKFVSLSRKDRLDKKSQSFIIPIDSDPTSEYLYEVVIFTSIYRNAGTSANVTIVLIGKDGDQSEPHVISDSTGRLLHRGAVDTFLISSKNNLGKVTKVRLWHDNSGIRR